MLWSSQYIHILIDFAIISTLSFGIEILAVALTSFFKITKLRRTSNKIQRECAYIDVKVCTLLRTPTPASVYTRTYARHSGEIGEMTGKERLFLRDRHCPAAM